MGAAGDKDEVWMDQDGDESDSAAEMSGDEFSYEDAGWSY